MALCIAGVPAISRGSALAKGGISRTALDIPENAFIAYRLSYALRTPQRDALKGIEPLH